MGPNIIYLPNSTSSEHLEALSEVKNFGRTDMGYPGQGPWTYCILSEESLNDRIIAMSGAKRYPFGVDAVSLQPCLSYASRSQDRYVTEEWNLPDGKWIFNVVLDGHLNHDTVDFIVQQLPRVVKDAFYSLTPENHFIKPAYVSELLRSAIRQVDDSLTSRVLNLLHMKKEDRVCNSTRPSNFPGADPLLVAQSLGGATLVLSLADSRGNLWIANLGDCRAVLGHRHTNGQGWSGFQVTSVHDLNNPEELIRMTRDHPGEVNVIKNNRVIGFLEPTRALGDTWLKIPASCTLRVYQDVKQPWISPKQFNDYASRILTPPYVSNIPDVYHLTPQIPYFLLLGSDGLLSTERYNGMNATQIIEHWINILGNAIDSGPRTNINCALCLLRDILGGEDINMVSRNLTVEMEERWMDDTTLLIQTVWDT